MQHQALEYGENFNHLHCSCWTVLGFHMDMFLCSPGNLVTSCHFWLDWKKISSKTLRKCKDFNARLSSRLLDPWLPLSLRTFSVKVGTPGHFERSVIHEATSTIETMYIEPKWYNLKTTNYSMQHVCIFFNWFFFLKVFDHFCMAST